MSAAAHVRASHQNAKARYAQAVWVVVGWGKETANQCLSTQNVHRNTPQPMRVQRSMSVLSHKCPATPKATTSTCKTMMRVTAIKVPEMPFSFKARVQTAQTEGKVGTGNRKEGRQKKGEGIGHNVALASGRWVMCCGETKKPWQEGVQSRQKVGIQAHRTTWVKLPSGGGRYRRVCVTRG